MASAAVVDTEAGLPPRVVLHRRPIQTRARGEIASRRLVLAVLVEQVAELLGSTRPTAVNLRWALDVMEQAVRFLPLEERVAAAYARAARVCAMS